MLFRKAVEADSYGILNIIGQAQSYFKDNGIDQWQNNYPNYQTIRDDIINGNGYVLIKDDLIVGTVALAFDEEKTYGSIYEGQWLSNTQYCVIHRMAVASGYKGEGLASVITGNIEGICIKKGIGSIKVDTHKDNYSMQKLLIKNGFVYCGIIYLEDNSERKAFEKLLQTNAAKSLCLPDEYCF